MLNCHSYNSACLYIFFYVGVICNNNALLHQWPNGSALKTGRREELGKIPGRACRTSRSEFSVVFSETLVNTG